MKFEKMYRKYEKLRESLKIRQSGQIFSEHLKEFSIKFRANDELENSKKINRKFFRNFLNRKNFLEILATFRKF